MKSIFDAAHAFVTTYHNGFEASLHDEIFNTCMLVTKKRIPPTAMMDRAGNRRMEFTAGMKIGYDYKQTEMYQYTKGQIKIQNYIYQGWKRLLTTFLQCKPICKVNHNKRI